MATGDAAKQAMGTLNAIQTLVENFPMNFLNKGKTYTSVIDFILDVLYALGITEDVILTYILQTIFKIDNIEDVTTKISSKVTAVSEAMYAKISEIDVESDFLEELEDGIKLILGEILTGLLSCSAIPEIPNWYCDEFGKGSTVEYGTLSIPVSTIDLFGKLLIPPAHKVGGNFYDIKDLQIDRIEGYDVSGNPISSKTVRVNDLYKTYDLNAFIWYVLNRGIDEPQKEKNKMMWDSRRLARRELKEDYHRQTDAEWNYWLNSKTSPDGYFIMSGDPRPAITKDSKDCRDFKDYRLFPIIQFTPDDELTSEPRLKVSIASQRYYKKGTFNKTMYEFNWDYLRSIKLFSSRVLLADMLATLLNGSLLKGLQVNLTVNQQIAEAKINAMISDAFEVDDMQVSDCYTTFSNEDYDKMLSETVTKRYYAKQTGNGQAEYYDVDKIISDLDSVNTATTTEGYITAIKKTVYDVTTDKKEGEDIYNVSASVDWQAWLNNIIMALAMPLIKQVLSPKVMLLVIINLEASGIVSLDMFFKDGKFDTAALLDFLLKKLAGLLLSIVRYLLDKLIMLLMKLFTKYIQPLLVEFSAIILLEALNDWIAWLNEALKCIPNFQLSKKSGANTIDEVHYADIEQIANKPETDSETTKCQ